MGVYPVNSFTIYIYLMVKRKLHEFGFANPVHILNSLRSDTKMWKPRSVKAL